MFRKEVCPTFWGKPHLRQPSGTVPKYQQKIWQEQRPARTGAAGIDHTEKSTSLGHGTLQRGHKAMSYFGSIYADQELPHRAKAVYMYLKDRSNAGDTCWPSVRRIAEDLKLSRRTVQRALTDLERHGFLERTHRQRPNGSLTSNLYRVK